MTATNSTPSAELALVAIYAHHELAKVGLKGYASRHGFGSWTETLDGEVTTGLLYNRPVKFVILEQLHATRVLPTIGRCATVVVIEQRQLQLSANRKNRAAFSQVRNPISRHGCLVSLFYLNIPPVPGDRQLPTESRLSGFVGQMIAEIIKPKIPRPDRVAKTAPAVAKSVLAPHLAWKNTIMD
jgi:hypothetical protein